MNIGTASAKTSKPDTQKSDRKSKMKTASSFSIRMPGGYEPLNLRVAAQCLTHYITRAPLGDKTFKDIAKYFSKEDWEEMGDFENVTHVYMKRIFDTMINLGLNTSTPSFMRTNIQNPKMDDCDDKENQEESLQMASSAQQSKLLKFIWDPHIEKLKSKKTSQNENDPKAMPGTAGLMKMSGVEQPKKQPTPLGQHNQRMKKETKIWSHRLCERKYHVVYEEISEPNKDD